jgi:selenocysteine lyase/cysteine desulfurase
LPNQGHFFNSALPGARFTPAGPDHAQIASVNGVMNYMEAVHDHHFEGQDESPAEKGRRVHSLFQQQERSLLQPLLNFLVEHPRTRLVGKDTVENRAPTVSFTVNGQASAKVASKLGQMNIGVGTGHCYAYRLIETLGLDIRDGVIRTSLVHYTSEPEVTRLVDALDQILKGG